MINSFFNPVKELFRGLYITAKNSLKDNVTLLYPEKKKNMNKFFRGKIQYIKENCIKCKLCQRVCPSKNTIQIDKYYSINYAQCIFCGNCVEYCPRQALILTPNYELASENKNDLIFKEELI